MANNNFKQGDIVRIIKSCRTCNGNRVGQLSRIDSRRDNDVRHDYVSFIPVRGHETGERWIVCDNCAVLAGIDEIEQNAELIYGKHGKKTRF